MNIGLNFFSPVHGGGFNTYNQNIIMGILEEDKNQYFIFINKSSKKTFPIPNYSNITIIEIKNKFSGTLLRQTWNQLILPVYVLLKKINILFCPTNIVPIILKLSKVKLMLVHHTNLPWLYPEDVPGSKLILFFQKLIIKGSFYASHKIVVDSDTASKELIDKFPDLEPKIKIILLGVDRERFSINNRLLDDKNKLPGNYFLSISGAVKYHCLKELVIAFEKFKTSNKNAPSLILISKKLDNEYFIELEKLVLQSPFNKEIYLLEDIESSLIPALYANANLYIFTSYCEVFGFTNLEAMCCETPVLTSNTSALPEICGDAAIYFDPRNSNDIFKKINQVYNDKDLKKDLIEKGKRQVKKYSWEATCKETRLLFFE